MDRFSTKRLFRHGGSKAVNLPARFVRSLPIEELKLEERDDGTLVLHPVDPLDSMESDPRFAQFLEALLADVLEHPEELKSVEDLGFEKLEKLLEGVKIEDE